MFRHGGGETAGAAPSEAQLRRIVRGKSARNILARAVMVRLLDRARDDVDRFMRIVMDEFQAQDIKKRSAAAS